MPADRNARFVAAVLRALAAGGALLAGGCMAQDVRPSPSWVASRAEPPIRRPVAPVAMPDFDEAVALVGDLKYVEAEKKFRQLAAWSDASGDAGRAAECVFWIGFCLEKQRRLPEARVQYDKAMREYPGTVAARMAAERLKRLATAPGPSAGP